MSPSNDPAEDLQIRFDYKGNGQHAQRKWTRVRSVAGVPGYIIGLDHDLRSITMMLITVWSFDDASATYVVRN